MRSIPATVIIILSITTARFAPALESSLGNGPSSLPGRLGVRRPPRLHTFVTSRITGDGGKTG